MTHTLNHIPMSAPDLSDRELEVVTQVLRTRQLSIGPQLEGFERAFASYVGTAHAAGVNSGTSGLHLCVIAAGIGEGDWVITTPFSFIASANCLLYERAVPIFVDVEPTSGNINPALVAEAVDELDRQALRCWRWLPRNLHGLRSTLGSRLKAVLPVHAFGQPANMGPILEVARQHQLSVIEDACEAIGAEYKGRKAGTLGDAAVFAFFPNKQMTTGEGGMIVTQRADWDVAFRSLRNQGRDGGSGAWLHHTRLGYNYRLDEMSAALGRVQLGRIEQLLAKREQVARWYSRHLAQAELIESMTLAPNTTRMSWFVYVVRVRPPLQRDVVMAALAKRGIAVRPYFSPIHLQPFYARWFGYRRGDFPMTEALGDTCLALPFSGVMSEEQVAHVCRELECVVHRLYRCN